MFGLRVRVLMLAVPETWGSWIMVMCRVVSLVVGLDVGAWLRC